MSNIGKETSRLKNNILEWDPDFTKVTVDEVKRISEAERSGFVAEEDIDWDSIGVDRIKD